MTTKKIRATDLKEGMTLVHQRGNIDVSSVIHFGSAMSVLGHRTVTKDIEYVHREFHWSAPVVKTKKEDVCEEVFLDLDMNKKVEVVDKR
jgi:hypothetical protein